MLWGGGAPFEVRDDGDLDDRYGKRVRLLGAVRDVLYELRTDARWEGAITAVASCTDEPEWAQECMRKFEVGPVGSGVCIKDVMQLEEIRKGNKSAPIYIYICICMCVCVCDPHANKSARAAPRPRRTVRTIRAARAAGRST